MYMSTFDAQRGILIVTVPLSSRFPSTKVEKVDVWDLQVLMGMVNGHPELQSELAEFIRDAEIGSLGISPAEPSLRQFSTLAPEPTELAGSDLLNSLSAIKAGQKHAVAFENWCEQALRYLFGDQFGIWMGQKKIEKGFHRIDLLARLVPVHAFWIALAQDFRTRYVVFEFKNYGRLISQDQIYTTEKYLFTSALRAVAVIVARKGGDNGAQRAIKGALRESGKLIMLISLEDVVTMINSKGLGDDPNNFMIQHLDEILTDISR